MLFKFIQQQKGPNKFSCYFLNSIQLLSTSRVVFYGRIKNILDNFQVIICGCLCTRAVSRLTDLTEEPYMYLFYCP